MIKRFFDSNARPKLRGRKVSDELEVSSYLNLCGRGCFKELHRMRVRQAMFPLVRIYGFVGEPQSQATQ